MDLKRLKEIISETVENSMTDSLTAHIDKRFEDLKRPVGNKLAGTFGSELTKNKPHNFDSYEKRDSGGFDSFQDFLKCVHEKNYKALEDLRPTTKDVESGEAPGSFLIPSKYQATLIESMQETEIVRGLCTHYTLKRGQGDSLTVPAVSAYDYSSNVAGLQAYWKGENVAYTESDPALRQISLKLNKLTILTDFTEEVIFGSAIKTDNLINKLFSDACSFELDNRFITSAGVGAGVPLSVTNGNDLITITAEDSQEADTLLAENLGNMMKRLTPGAWNSSVWLCSVSNIMMLLKLGFKMGTAAMPLKAFNEVNGKFFLLGRPVIFTQFCDELGEAGSIMLCNWKRYAVLSRDNIMIRSDEGKGAGFASDRVKFKLTYYVDGQPLDSSTTLLRDGVTTVANFVTVPSI